MKMLDDLPDEVWAMAFAILRKPITDELAARIANDIRNNYSNDDDGLEKAVCAWIDTHRSEI
jgi:hypothetical protein